MGYEYQMPFHCIADGDFPAFLLRMIGVRKGGRERIEEHRGRVFKGDGVFVEVGRRLARVPLKSHVRSLSHGIVDCRRLGRGARPHRPGARRPGASHWRNVRAACTKDGAIRTRSILGDRKNLSSAFQKDEDIIVTGQAYNGYRPPMSMVGPVREFGLQMDSTGHGCPYVNNRYIYKDSGYGAVA